MKESFNYLLLVVAISCLGMLSCKGNKPEPPQDDNSTIVDVLSCNYEGNDVYQLTFATQGAIRDEPGADEYIYIKKGALYCLKLISIGVGEDIKPKDGIYTISLDGAAMTLDKEESYVWAFDENGKYSEDRYFFSEGTLTVNGNKLTFKGKDENNVEYNLSFEGNYSIKDIRLNPWEEEPQSTSTIEKNYNSGVLLLGRVYEPTNTRSVLLLTDPDAEHKLVASIVFITSGASDKLMPGSYTVSDSQEINTILKSKGSRPSNNGKKIYGNSLIGSASGDIYVAPVYFVDSGNAIVTETSVTFEGLSHFGSRLKVTYTGNMRPESQ